MPTLLLAQVACHPGKDLVLRPGDDVDPTVSGDADTDADSDTDADADADSDADTDPVAEGCGPWEPATGPVVPATPADDLPGLLAGLSPGDTLELAAGTYPLGGAFLWVSTPTVTIRGATGNAADVVLDGGYTTGEIVTVAADDVVIADLTLANAYNHGVHVVGGDTEDTTGTVLWNVHVLDPGQQAVKINTGGYFTTYADDGLVACSRLELTDAGRGRVRDSCYTGGIDAHQTRGWVVRDNVVSGFWCPSGLSEHGIHFWRGNRDTLIERNVVLDCARGIGLGLVDCCNGDNRTFADDPCPSAGGAYVDDWGGTVRNNVVWAGDVDLFASQYGFDSGIALASACDATVVHNTVLSSQAPFSSIEWRFDTTLAEVHANLASHGLVDRGGAATVDGNLEQQPLSVVVDAAGGDFHLAPGSPAIDAAPAGWASEDFEGDPRGAAPDVGADELTP